jgi:hypothetical protein
MVLTGNMERTMDEEDVSVRSITGAGERKLADHRKRILILSLAVTLEKMQHLTGRTLVREVIELLHNENFDVTVFRDMIRTGEDCHALTEEVINKNMTSASWSEKGRRDPKAP